MQINISDSKVKPIKATLTNVRVATLEMMHGLVPEKRNGKTPPSMLVEFDEGKLFFILEDIQDVIIRLNGLSLNMGKNVWTFTEAR